MGIIFVVIMAIPLTLVPPVTEPINQGLSNLNSINYNLPNLNSTNSTNVKRWVQVSENIEGRIETLYLPYDDFLFNVEYDKDEQNQVTGVHISLKPEFTDLYNQIGFFNKPSDTIIVYPIFTQEAYGQNGFYDYYNKKCDVHCLTVNILTQISPIYQSSLRSYLIFKLLNYDMVTDIDVDKNPNMIKKYNKVIVLHNEYVTQREFDAITAHPHVIYLYPNALYAKVQTDYDKNTFTLIRGHGYPDANIANGFDWKFDNSKYEYDIACNNWKFYKVNNGEMLNCWPSFRMELDESLLRAISQ